MLPIKTNLIFWPGQLSYHRGVVSRENAWRYRKSGNVWRYRTYVVLCTHWRRFISPDTFSPSILDWQCLRHIYLFKYVKNCEDHTPLYWKERQVADKYIYAHDNYDREVFTTLRWSFFPVSSATFTDHTSNSFTSYPPNGIMYFLKNIDRIIRVRIPNKDIHAEWCLLPPLFKSVDRSIINLQNDWSVPTPKKTFNLIGFQMGAGSPHLFIKLFLMPPPRPPATGWPAELTDSF